jgi:hypothetical protein
MFDDLDATLQAMLADAAAPADLRAADVGFDTPDQDYKPAQATINLFLHEVAENRALRDEARVIERTGDTYTSRLPSLRVDCSYLVTAWSAKTGGLRAQEEHHLLGLALIWLSRFPVIDDRFLQGTLKTPAQPYPLATMVAQTNEGQPMAHFWSALGVPPSPAFSRSIPSTRPSSSARSSPSPRRAPHCWSPRWRAGSSTTRWPRCPAPRSPWPAAASSEPPTAKAASPSPACPSAATA